MKASDTSANELKEFLVNDWKKYFTDELRENIKVYKENLEADSIIDYNESALLSIFLCSLIRQDSNTEITAVQEYLLYNKKKKYQRKRADLFMSFRQKGGLNCNVLIEAKQFYKYNPKYIDVYYNYKKVTKQAEGYYEEGWYKDGPTFCIALFFEHIDHPYYNDNTTDKIKLLKIKKDYDNITLPVLKDVLKEEYQTFLFDIPVNRYILYVYGYIWKHPKSF